MPIEYEKLMNWKIPEVEHVYSKRDTMLYALGVGLGSDPCDANQLKFVYEQNLQALPAMAIILGYPGPWHGQPGTGVNRSKSVHGAQGFTLHRPLAAEGAVIGHTRVVAVVDKGQDKGALLMIKNEVRDRDSGEPVCTLTSTTFCRADGGFGGPDVPVAEPTPIPQTPPDLICDLPTLPQAALIYRLSGDYNPLHADPAHAAKSGFKQPILHGRCTFSIACHALVKSCCDYDPTRLKSMSGRFSSPVFPGETIRTEIWRNGNSIVFRATIPERNVTVLNNGSAEII